MSSLKSPAHPLLIDMPAFDLDSVLRLDALNQENMRSSFQFAHKFYTRIERGKDGNEWLLADGTRVWQVSIRSKGAYSLNVLFTEFQVPEGARLFLYNTDHSYVIGSFDHRNNSSAGLLPVKPVAGETLIVEYTEPADAAFRGKLTIGEVNHDYRDILRKEPDIDLTNGAFDCMPDVVCEEVDETTVRSTVLLMINGTTSCTGTLLNNTANDGAPYILTAVHCLNDDISRGISNYHKEWDYYIDKAGTVIVFFNYARPVCGTTMNASEEFSMAVTYPRTIIEGKDIALLELQEKPPAYYNAYYAGWRLKHDAKPYTNIHHPQSAVKKYNTYKDNLTWMSFHVFDPNSHLQVAAWTTGSTHAGSSGSPLFDANHAVIGGLSGGWSVCGTPNPRGTHDAFFALSQGWETAQPDNQLKTYLDPHNTGAQASAGMDPNKENPVIRLRNTQYLSGNDLITTQYTGPNSGFVFGHSNLNITEFAEEFNPEYEAELQGAYFLIPKMEFAYTQGVEIRVYEGDNAPEQLIATQELKPQFLNYSSQSGFGLRDKSMSFVATENFVRFDQPVPISKKFFIAYRINNEEDSRFVVYNTSFRPGNTNTAWMNRNGTWVRASSYVPSPITTSLAIEALLNYSNISVPGNEDVRENIRYIRSEARLLLPETMPGSGQLLVYAISGQLLQRIPIDEAQNTVTIYPQAIGTIGIVRLIRDNQIYTGKFIY
ncbi:MAG: trypsin-like peptidase domain-containing protein [Dysgonamonadaceae bacterium]|nr:trypsin-like peptidase domain-containing protein [Dysgonamonadaceae bacterium]